MILADPQIPEDISRHVRELGPLESPLIWSVLAGCALFLVIIAITFWHRKRARNWTGSIAVCCLLLAGLAGLNSYVGFVRTFDDLGRLLERGNGVINAIGQLIDNESDEPTKPARTDFASKTPKSSRGDDSAPAIEQVSIASDAQHVPSGKTYVILPPGYNSPVNEQRRYPVVYLIHGYPFGDPQDWLNAGDAPTTMRMMLDAKIISPMIVVSVDMTAGNPSQDWECLNVPGGPQLEDYLTQTVVSTIDQHYRTVADRSGRALGGMSGGGFGALNIGLHHTDEFGVLLSALPYDDPDQAAAFFHGDETAIRANTPREYLPTMHFANPVSLMLAVGTGAPADVATAKRIASDFQQRGQEATVHAEHGFNHTWHTARATLPYLLLFANQHFHRPGSAVPAVNRNPL